VKPSTRLWLASLYLFIMGTASLAYTIAELMLGVKVRAETKGV
jgi:hypothetical protein